MTRNEMHTAFKVELDKTESLELPAFEAEEIDYWLNQATLDFVKQHYRRFEQNREISEALRVLVVELTLNTTIGIPGVNKPNSYIADLDDPDADGSNADSIVDQYMYALNEQSAISFTDDDGSSVSEKRQGVTPCALNEYDYKVNDPHSPHVLHYGGAKPLRLYYGTTVELISDGNYTVDKYYLRYLRFPATIGASVDCDLPVANHDEIVRLAVRKALENIEQPRFRTYVDEQRLEQ